MKEINRRQFLKYGMGGLAALVVGSEMDWIFDNKVYAAKQVATLNFRIADAVKEMVTHNSINTARCYFWIYQDASPNPLPPDCPGPLIFATKGAKIQITVTNDLDENHAFAIPSLGFTTGPIAPGQTVTKMIKAKRSGTFLYYDDMNAPVNRVMGLHGAFIVMPAKAKKGQKYTPYDKPTPAIQSLFNDLGSSAHFPGLAWEDGDSNPDSFAPPFRQYVWLFHEASPLLFEEVGNFPAGEDFPATLFVDAFHNDPYADTFHTGVFNKKPHFFTIDGQSGHFSHNNPFICPNLRVGEPCIIRILNAGLQIHSTHIHANHVYVLSYNTNSQEIRFNPNNLFWVDTWTLHPLDTYDWLVPYMRPPDVPNEKGIGLPDAPLAVDPTPIPAPWGPAGGPTPAGVTAWPPIQELNMFIPPVGTLANGGTVDISVQLSPACFPMHDHSETTQTSQGGNYNLGTISGMNFTGDRNIDPAGVVTFPNAPTVFGPDYHLSPQPPAGPEDAGM